MLQWLYGKQQQQTTYLMTCAELSLDTVARVRNEALAADIGISHSCRSGPDPLGIYFVWGTERSIYYRKYKLQITQPF